ncbi:MAG: hypothetical protein D6685_02875 [Bacteroidetes bacterium]|nr:MAG: hypothetical protein D6685_02875 [Bacteroidota bacterium]
MLIPVLGSTGMGLVWGWLIAQRQSHRPRLRTAGRVLAVVAGTALAAGLNAAWIGPPGLTGFLIATGIALAAHLGWLHVLHRQAPPLLSPSR